ncbi:MAG: hypothetical protein ACI4DK_01385 [Lachnospiraceae bacterium]
MDSELFSKILFDAEALPYIKKNPAITDRKFFLPEIGKCHQLLPRPLKRTHRKKKKSKIFPSKIGKSPFLLPSPTDNESGGTTMNDKTIH